MNAKVITLIEVFATPFCNRCQGASRLVEALTRELKQEMLCDNIQWREINIIEEIDYAVQLGIVATPAIAINGKLVFSSLPAKKKLKSTLQDIIQPRPKC
jgi:glutaredoxin